MILEIEDWHLGYDQIVKDTRGSEVGSVWVLANADVDSLAAARILTYMFRADSIPYQLRPCWSYSSLTSLLKREESQDIRALVLLNLGAARNLTKLFDVDMLLANAKVYVMDCRKPVHLANVHAGLNVVVFWDETQKKESLPSDGDNLSGNDETTDEDEDSSDEDSDDSDEENEDDDPDEGEVEFEDEEDKKKKRDVTSMRASDNDQDHDYDGEAEDGEAEEEEDDEQDKKSTGEDQGIENTSTKRRKTGDDDESSATTEENPDIASLTKKETTPALPMLTPRELHQKRRNRLRGYYSEGSFYGSPVAWVAYRLASQKRWNDNGDLLWLACVGLTDAYLHARIDKSGYTTLSVDLQASCQRVFPNEMVDRVEKTIYAESLMGKDTGSQTQVTLSDNGRILAEKDYRFFLLRHSSLYDSMIYSNYVANRLQVWNTQGKQRLHEFLAKMGFSLEECKQPFAFMNPHLKRKLTSKMTEYAKDYGLDQLIFTSFQRVTGYKSLVSASDMSYAVTGLLEAETNECFYAALDALNAKAIPNTLSEGYSASNLVNGGSLASAGIGAGLLKAINLQKNIVFTAMSLVERKAITSLRHFRYAFITCTSQESKDTFKASANDVKNKKSEADEEGHHHIFGQPLALARLAHWVMDMHRENGKWMGNKSRPLVLCAEKPATKSYLVVGYEFPEKQGLFLKNHFGQHFQMTCNSMKGEFRLNSFDSNVVEVDAKDVQRFIEQLHYMMDTV